MRNEDRRPIPRSSLALSAAALISFALAATGAGAELGAAEPTPETLVAVQMPTDPAEAMRVFESDISNFDKGPASYLFVEDESDIWDDLGNDDERQLFIQWFWDRRDDDLRDREHPFKEGFYTRVAEANRRFSGFPRGWRSDRGRVWIIFGRPIGMRANLGSEVWSYTTPGSYLASVSYLGEMQVAFRQVDVGRWEIYGGIGPGVWPPYLLQAFQLVNRAGIEDPRLEFNKN